MIEELVLSLVSNKGAAKLQEFINRKMVPILPPLNDIVVNFFDSQARFQSEESPINRDIITLRYQEPGPEEPLISYKIEINYSSRKINFDYEPKTVDFSKIINPTKLEELIDTIKTIREANHAINQFLTEYSFEKNYTYCSPLPSSGKGQQSLPSFITGEVNSDSGDVSIMSDHHYLQDRLNHLRSFSNDLLSRLNQASEGSCSFEAEYQPEKCILSSQIEDNFFNGVLGKKVSYSLTVDFHNKKISLQLDPTEIKIDSSFPEKTLLMVKEDMKSLSTLNRRISQAIQDYSQEQEYAYTSPFLDP